MSSLSKTGTFVQGGQAVFLGLVIISLITLFIQYIILRFQYKPLYDWWAQNNGKKYDNMFSIFALISANSNTPLYYMNKLFTSPLSQLTLTETRFIYIYILPSLRYYSGGKQYGYITPRILCNSILPSVDDNDFRFNEWLKTAERAGQPIDLTKILRYSDPKQTPNKINPNIMDITFEYHDTSQQQGLFPASSKEARFDWMGLILEWLNGSTDNPDPLWVWQQDASKVYHPILIKTDTDDPFKHWNDESRGDNFLRRLNIAPNSPLITSYVSDLASTEAIKLDPEAFINIISNSGAVAGGFIRFLQGLEGSSTILDDYATLLYSESYINAVPSPPTCVSSSASRGAVAGVSSFISSIFSIILMGALAPATGGASFAFGMSFSSFATLGALAVGSAAINGYQASKGTC